MEVIKSERALDSAKGKVNAAKRTFDGEIKQISLSFDDKLRFQDDSLFPKFVLPKLESKVEKVLGLTLPKPDYVYGFQRPQFPNPNPKLNATAEALINLVSNLEHIFFAVENKGCEGSIEDAENQAMRTGAAMVNARMMLNDMAQPDTYQRPAGADEESFHFTCAWIPTLAEIFVHWHELREDGASIYHMNKVGSYLMERDKELVMFRKHVHNILDWGILDNLPAVKQVVKAIEEKA
ncbi:MAG: hypothetical protein Q9164_006776 [Protoblastenia rupestris]